MLFGGLSKVLQDVVYLLMANWLVAEFTLTANTSVPPAYSADISE